MNRSTSASAAPRSFETGVTTNKVSPVMGALQDVHSSHSRVHTQLDALESALTVALRDEPEIAGANGQATPKELPQSALHAELLQAGDESYAIERRIDRLIQRLSL